MSNRLALVAVALLCCSLPARAESPAQFDSLIGEAKAAMMAEPDKALGHATAAEKAAATIPTERERRLAIAQAQWLEGEALNRVNLPEKAAPVIARALATVTALDPRSKLHGDLVLAAATINTVTGQLPKALAQFQQAYGIFSALGEARSQAKVLQYIGSIYVDARDYPRVLKYYAQSVEVYKGDPALTIAAYNNLGETLKEMRRFREAEQRYQVALRVARQVDSPMLEVRILNNIASAQLNAGDLKAAQATINRAFERARGLQSGDEPFIWGVQAQIALARGDRAAAAAALDHTFRGVSLQSTTQPYRVFHETAYRLYSATGEPARALAHFAAFKRLDDQAREVTVSANAALIGARFDFANQELSIAKLKAGQLQRDIALERSRANQRAILFWSALGTALVVVIGTLLAFFSIRRSRNEVRDANVTLSEVNFELEKALTAKTRFLATTSHEIRTPLNGILGMTQVMLHDQKLAADQRDRVRIVHDAGTMMKTLVDDILDVAKIETGKLVIESAEIDARPLFEGVARLWTGEAAAKGLALAVDLKGCPDRVCGDARRIRQIVFNLMSNAVKFTEKGSIRLKVAADNGELVLTVADTGIGIPESQREKVFESFHQVDGDVTRKYGGTGLGLAISRELAHAMGGEISLESEIGRGTTFTVRLPLGQSYETGETPLDPWPAALADASVLVVEANALTRSVIAAALAPSFKTVVAVGGEEAVEAATRQRFHHAILDRAALGTGGYAAELFCRVAAGAQGARMDITLLAADPVSASDEDAFAACGLTRILKRPIALTELVKVIAEGHSTPADAPKAVAA